MGRTWLVLGGTGMLGQDLVALLQRRGVTVVALGSAGCDITDRAEVERVVAEQGPDVVVNCAAHTAVDAAETEEAAAFALNATGAFNVARAARSAAAQLVHVSTDYVFDGRGTTPYDVDHPQDPRSAYGRTKAAGEWAVRATHPDALVVRTAWLYGAHGPNFVATMLTLAGKRETLDVVADQIGQPTWTGDLAETIIGLVEQECPGGFYHGTSSGQGSWFDLAQEAFRLTGLDPERVRPTTSEAFQRPAPRPAYSVLARSPRGPSIGDWRARLAASGVVQQERAAERAGLRSRLETTAVRGTQPNGNEGNADASDEEETGFCGERRRRA